MKFRNISFDDGVQNLGFSIWDSVINGVVTRC